jgi:hypothetical protein
LKIAWKSNSSLLENETSSFWKTRASVWCLLITTTSPRPAASLPIECSLKKQLLPIEKWNIKLLEDYKCLMPSDQDDEHKACCLSLSPGLRPCSLGACTSLTWNLNPSLIISRCLLSLPGRVMRIQIHWPAFGRLPGGLLYAPATTLAFIPLTCLRGSIFEWCTLLCPVTNHYGSKDLLLPSRGGDRGCDRHGYIPAVPKHAHRKKERTINEKKNNSNGNACKRAIQ